MTTETDRLLKEIEAAKVLDVKPQTLQAWRIRGTHDLPFRKIGRNVRYALSDLRAFLERSRCNNTAEAAAK